MGLLDYGVFLIFVISVIAIGLWRGKEKKSPDGQDAQDYFLAGRGLTWWLIGFSLIAANISTEQFVGMSGEAANWLGMAIASYEWMAAVTLVVVAFVFLPKFLRSGIYTIPEFLEYRYNWLARVLMAVCTLIILVGVPTASVIYSGAKVITGNFQGQTLWGYDLGNITVGCWIIGTLAAVYVFSGGLKACAKADLLQGSALILGGIVLALFAFQFLSRAKPEELIRTARNQDVTVEQLADAGPIQRFWDLNKGPLPDGKVHMVRDNDDPKIPWSALLIGLWIPNFFYWGLNQYITQRTLGSKSLAEGQKGVVFAAALKLIIPFIVVIPGILAFNLFNSDLADDAVNRNARVMSKSSPDLYRSLSDQVKPKDIPRNEGVLAEIEENLADHAAAVTAADDAGPPIYKFDELFAEMHPEDARAVLDYNRRTVPEGVVLEPPPSDRASAEELAAFSEKMTGTAAEAEAVEISVETLVAHDYDNAFPTLIRNLLPVGLGIKGFVLAALFGAVVSSLASMLNSASTIATMDLYFRVRKNASQRELVTVGRVWVIVFVLIAMCIAPFLGSPRFGGIFNFIQEFQGFISPGILAIFLFGLLVHRAPRIVGVVGLLLNPALYGILKYAVPDLSFLNRMAICFFVVMAVLTLITVLRPLEKPVVLPENKSMNLDGSKGAKVFGLLVVILTAALYVIFW